MQVERKKKRHGFYGREIEWQWMTTKLRVHQCALLVPCSRCWSSMRMRGKRRRIGTENFCSSVFNTWVDIFIIYWHSNVVRYCQAHTACLEPEPSTAFDSYDFNQALRTLQRIFDRFIWIFISTQLLINEGIVNCDRNNELSSGDKDSSMEDASNINYILSLRHLIWLRGWIIIFNLVII